MEKCSVIIGGLFGDEGKGHMVDICANELSTLNVRFNGGAQASHTVVTPDGKRHAFRHFGSGTFAGAVTYLSKDFIVNVFAFSVERRKLYAKFGIIPGVYVHHGSIVTTLPDIYINQMIEKLRGKDRHGSCGMGINETVERSKFADYLVTVQDLLNLEQLRKKLARIQFEYVPMRLELEYGLSFKDLPKSYQKKLSNKENIDMSLFYAKEFTDNVQIVDDYILNRYDNVVFEGAQGLLLDQNCRAYWPHVTTSNTGISNVMGILNDLKFTGDISMYYMSRCYATRHGEGPFSSETKHIPYRRIVDLTNVPNEYQGNLRFGLLDVDTLSEAINNDLKNLDRDAKVFLTFTCTDQLDDVAEFVTAGERKDVKSDQFLATMSNVFDSKLSKLDGIFATNGETRNDIIRVC